jgi:hypothetical protein
MDGHSGFLTIPDVSAQHDVAAVTYLRSGFENRNTPTPPIPANSYV